MTVARPSYKQLLSRYSQVRRRHRLPALACVPVFLLAAFYVLVLAGQQAERAGLQAAIAQAAEQRAEKQAYIAHAQAYNERLHRLETQLRAAHVVLPDNAEVPQFLAQIGTTAHDIGLSIERFEPRPEVAHDFYAEIGFHVQVRGSFHQVAMFVAQIGAMERIVNVANINLSVAKGDAAAPHVDGGFDLKIFRFLSDEQMLAASKAKKAQTP